jgi:hypothetical protein
MRGCILLQRDEEAVRSNSISVVVLNWNGKRYLKRCLDSIANQTCKPFEVILVDNNSKDGSVAFVKKNYPWVKIIRMNKNLGSSEGHNVGIREAKGDWIVILDHDLYLDKNWLKENLKATSLTQVGIIGGSVRSYDPPHRQFFFPNRFFPSARYPWAILSYFPRNGKFLRTDVIQSCAMMINREVVEKIGMFDRCFYFWNEDVDFCLRAKRSFFEVVFNPKAVVYHKVGGLKGRVTRIKLFLDANVKFARKNYPFWQFLFAIISIALANILFFILKRCSK